jgi:hypothetical protein
MSIRKSLITVCAVAVLAAPGVGISQTKLPERFSFTPSDTMKGGPGTQGRFDVVINRWSTDTERETIWATATEKGPDQILEALSRNFEHGYIKLPGALQYIVRYAHRISRPDGTEDLVLATDHPVFFWWDSSKPTSSTNYPFTLIQLRLKQGRGEGKLSLTGKVGTDKSAKAIVLEDFASQPALLTDVRREASQTSN